jgi:hypothetical protein
MRRGFMAATLGPSGAVVMVGLMDGRVPSSCAYQTLGPYAPTPRPAERRADLFWDVLGDAPHAGVTSLGGSGATC